MIIIIAQLKNNYDMPNAQGTVVNMARKPYLH